jgi:hypothetical protein
LRRYREPDFRNCARAANRSHPAFNGSDSGAGLHASDGGVPELEVEREIEGGGLKTKVRIEGVLRK